MEQKAGIVHNSFINSRLRGQRWVSGLNLAKGDFLDKRGHSGAQIGRASDRCSGRDAPNGILDGRKVRRNHLRRSVEHTERINLSERAVEWGRSTWSNGEGELETVHIRIDDQQTLHGGHLPLSRSLTVNFLAFAAGGPYWGNLDGRRPEGTAARRVVPGNLTCKTCIIPLRLCRIE
jgi:hypothetical protein